jgi:hypothetical protein
MGDHQSGHLETHLGVGQVVVFELLGQRGQI